MKKQRFVEFPRKSTEKSRECDVFRRYRTRNFIENYKRNLLEKITKKKL